MNKYLLETFVDDFVSKRKSGWLPYRRGDVDAEREYEKKWSSQAKRIQKRVRHADGVLNSTPVGETVCFEGSCPSGETYSGFVVWDGTDECRESVLEKAARHAGNDAWAAWLVRESDNRGAIAVADMRMG